VPFFKAGSIKYYKFPSLDNSGVYHALFTRHGGISPFPWNSLNFGASVGDDIQRVLQNREKALSVIKVKPESVYDTYQIHSNEIVLTDQPLPMNSTHLKADAIITNKSNVTLMMRFADCVPILLFDPVTRAIGILHAGWKGTVNKIAGKTVLEMEQNYGTNPKNLLAAIGPSIGPDHYTVGSDVVEKVHSSFGDKSEQLIVENRGKVNFDLWKANQVVLNEVGVTKIEISGICTSCNLNDWFSHRSEHGKTGRFGVVIGLCG
jgi:YfiH family protein